MTHKYLGKKELGKQMIDAARAGNIEGVKRLLERGAEVDARDHDGETAMMAVV
ncbi:MAG: ankyrin repeat domain-containing protein [Candidatus Marsarchaeota archaeon]|nr:ankyrin repeat domain-containing protein [Candidatus Marsarchaeota archaeon]MCL5418453.1 ankyrin repeat domain-containing protein [Candidatus Marsarchaeota archaeon]